MYPKKDKDGCLIFKNYPEFRPNKTPKEMFTEGIMDMTYFRPITVEGKHYKNEHKKYTFLKGIPEDKLSRCLDKADKSMNKYGVHVGTTLEFWLSKGWIKPEWNSYGWISWYCDFYNGRRCDDDQRQIKRWLGVTGPNGRFKKNLIRQINNKNSKYDDYSISPGIRQTLLHWGYELTKKDYENGVNELKEKFKI